MGAVSGLMLFNCIANVAVDQSGSGLGGYLGGGDPAGECFKPLVENKLHRVGIFQQDLEHPRSVWELDHLVDLHARVQLLNLGLKLRFRVFSHKSLDLADKNRLPSEEVRWGEGS